MKCLMIATGEGKQIIQQGYWIIMVLVVLAIIIYSIKKGGEAMKRKVLLSVLVIFVILALVGCYPGYDPYWVPEDDIIELVNYYWCCISEGWYWCAQNLCCVPYGDTWYQVEEYQNMTYPEGTIITYEPYYNWIHIDGNEAIANIDLVITTCLEDICSTETICNYSMYSVKTVNWFLK